MTGRRIASAALVLLLGAGLAGCGDDLDEKAYCATLKKDQTVFSEDGTGLALVTGVAKLEKMAAAAPDDLADEWQTFLTALHGLDDALDEAGLKPSDFVDGQPPSSLSASARSSVAAAASRLADDDVVSAVSGIEQQAKDVCKLQLGLS